jgi:hypothetical protein
MPISINQTREEMEKGLEGLEERLEGMKNEILFHVNIIQREIDVGLKVFLRVFVDS